MTALWDQIALTPFEVSCLAIIIVAAGIVRGFSGFALSALVMAAGVVFLPPVQLIPVLWFQEMAASLLMARGGWRDADRRTVALLVAGTWIGWPIGLTMTGALDVESSKLVALLLILSLAVMQLSKLRIPGLTTTTGTISSGIVAGFASGTAHVGGMVVALFVMAQGSQARSMRGSLVLYLFVSSLGGVLYQLGFGVMNTQAALRGLLFVPLTMVGVLLGAKLFMPRWEPYYRPFCLSLLIFLAGIGLIRTALT